ncbi:hypothetical protein PMAYCL1PPCAC_14762, partial [Pristionchus mayeri]
MCSCTHDDCTTSSLYPADSGLPLDTRDAEMIDCATPSDLGGMRKCRGHACFMMKQPDRDDAYGCIVYDKRFMDKKYKLGGARTILHYSFYICDTSMCNAIANPDKIFEGLANYEDPNNGTCNCLAPLGSSMDSPEVHQAVGNLPLILGVSVPVALLVFAATVVVGYRVWKKKWPLPIQIVCEKSRGRGHVKPVVINVVSPEGAHVKKK